MTVRPYPAYKDSGEEWIGLIPFHWHVLALKHVVNMKSGEQITADAIEEVGPYPVFGGNGLRGYTTEFTHEGHFALIGRQGALCGNVNYAHGKFWASEHAVVVSPKLPCAVSWLGELLRAMDLGQYSVTAAQPGLSVEAVGNLAIPLPSQNEQSAIAAFLDRETGKIDALVAEQERLMALLKEKRQAVISQAVTKGLNPNAKMKPSGVEWLGEVPEEWEVARLKFLAEVQGGIAKGRDVSSVVTIQVPYIRVANVQAGYLDLDEIAMIDIEPHELERYALRAGDVLMNEGGDFDKLGRGAIWRGDIDPCIHQNHVFAVRPHNIEPEWLTLVTSADYGRFFFMSYAKQSTNLASISSTNLQEMPVVCPPADERVRILEHANTEVGQIDTLTAETTHAIALLKERRAALISAAVTGKIDLRDLAAAAQTAA